MISLGQSNKCSNSVSFGDVVICVPEMLNMTECYSNPIVNTYANMFKGTNDEKILAFFISNNEYDDLYSTLLEDGLKEPYIKMYSTSMIENIYVSKKDLNTVSLGIKSAFDEYEGSDVESRINSKASEFDMSFAKPILFDEYSLDSNIKSFVAIMNMSANNESVVMVAIMNLLIVKNRLLFFAYYDEYRGVDKIEKMKSNSDYFALSLLEKNQTY
tara:strand:+ start:1501 stop:2145 length:645 start_codon:yes stop_codon:yes gene_type:complete